MQDDFIVGSVKRGAGSFVHENNRCEPIGPYVLRIDIIGMKDGLEFITGVLESGRIHTVVLSGTVREGWVVRAMREYGHRVFLGSWVELGGQDGEMAIELLLSPRDFDAVYADRLQQERPDKYRMWKSTHRVPQTVPHDGRLYYARTPHGRI